MLQFVDRRAIDEIQKQIHLLSTYDKYAVDIFMSSQKISNIYLMNGFHWYFSDVRENMKCRSMSFGTHHFEEQFTESIHCNVIYKETEYISRVKFNEEWCYIEHISPLTEEEFSRLITKHD